VCIFNTICQLVGRRPLRHSKGRFCCAGFSIRRNICLSASPLAVYRLENRSLRSLRDHPGRPDGIAVDLYLVDALFSRNPLGLRSSFVLAAWGFGTRGATAATGRIDRIRSTPSGTLDTAMRRLMTVWKPGRHPQPRQPPHKRLFHLRQVIPGPRCRRSIPQAFIVRWPHLCASDQFGKK
jgi:hypothetical protein